MLTLQPSWKIVDGAQAGRDHLEKADVCIIGTGAGGAVAAATLAGAGLSVVLLEEGAYHTGREFDGKPLPMFDLLYRQRGLTSTLGNVVIPLPMGRCVGGTTTINSGTCYRAPQSVLERWEREFGVTDVASEETAGNYDFLERELGVTPVAKRLLPKGARRFMSGAEKLGYAGAPIPRNEKGCKGSGVCAFGCPRDAKQGMHVSMVPRALDAGALLFTNCRAEGLLADHGRVWGVQAKLADGSRLRVTADAIIVACGAVHSPAFLQRSGLRLSPALGRNLHIHPAARVAARFDEAVEEWKGVPQSYNIHQFTEEGIFIQGQFIPPGVEAPTLPGLGHEHKERMGAYDRLASFGALISDETGGRIIATGAEPVIWYWMQPEDVRKLVRGIALTAEVFFAAGAREVYPGLHGFPVLRSAQEARALESRRFKASDLDMMAFHPQGTCRMSRDPLQGVTDPWGKVHGVKGLYVADASLFPTSCKVNPQMTIMALARRTAEGIHRLHRLHRL